MYHWLPASASRSSFYIYRIAGTEHLQLNEASKLSLRHGLDCEREMSQGRSEKPASHPIAPTSQTRSRQSREKALRARTPLQPPEGTWQQWPTIAKPARATRLRFQDQGLAGPGEARISKETPICPTADRLSEPGILNSSALCDHNLS